MKKTEAEIKKVSGQIPTTLVMRERPTPRPTHVQIRGDFLRKGDPVVPGFPAALDAAKRALEEKIPHEMLLLDLYNALRPLDAITGATTNDDILNLIFSTFCIGK